MINKVRNFKRRDTIIGVVETKGLRLLLEPRLSPDMSRITIANPPITPCFTITCEAWILNHTKMGLCPRWTSKKSIDEKYLALKILNIIVSWLVVNFQPCFPNMVRLKAYKCLNFIPPNSFFIIILSNWANWFISFVVIAPPKTLHHFLQNHLLKWNGAKKHSCSKRV